ncbi:hypothetical protein QQX98_009349 [Neonectria punicea]|uniref:Carboxylic ester hydrolase n=1 Tax=Neonectria punicea TaxID=979145 RepID=A0ABR1GSJ0_9HYPO
MFQELIFWILVLVCSTNAVKVKGHRVEYLGVHNKTTEINTFWGIRYAKAPVGNLRWRAPVTLKPHDSLEKVTINATVPGPACYQNIGGWQDASTSPYNQSEDCLILNIQTPNKPKLNKLPVLVMIHGGGYVSGSAQYSTGDSLVHQANRSMIFVSLQYRLGPLGFLAGDIVEENGTANAGLLDQRSGLEWVRENIAYFGGDPFKITVTGGSAGGGSVTMQMILYGGDPHPPFHAAISEFPWWTPTYDRKWVNKQYDRFAKATDCSSLRCLRELSIKDIQTAARDVSVAAYLAKEYPYGTYYWGPVIDGSSIRANPQEEFRNGHFIKVPIIVDRNFDEGFIFSNTSISTEEELMSDLEALWHDKDGYFPKIALDFYPESVYNTSHLDDLPVRGLLKTAGAINDSLSNAFVRRSALFGDAIVNCPSTYIAQAVAEAGVPAYKLVFNAGYQLHSATGSFLFNNYTDGE